jgi:hypothetical protein
LRFCAVLVLWGSASGNENILLERRTGCQHRLILQFFHSPLRMCEQHMHERVMSLYLFVPHILCHC